MTDALRTVTPLPCPWCAEEPEVHKNYRALDGEDAVGHKHSEYKRCPGNSRGLYTIEQWNRRAAVLDSAPPAVCIVSHCGKCGDELTDNDLCGKCRPLRQVNLHGPANEQLATPPTPDAGEASAEAEREYDGRMKRLEQAADELGRTALSGDLSASQIGNRILGLCGDAANAEAKRLRRAAPRAGEALTPEFAPLAVGDHLAADQEGYAAKECVICKRIRVVRKTQTCEKCGYHQCSAVLAAPRAGEVSEAPNELADDPGDLYHKPRMRIEPDGRVAMCVGNHDWREPCPWAYRKMTIDELEAHLQAEAALPPNTPRPT